MGPNQTQKLLHSREAINKMKRQPTEWVKIFANDVTKGYFQKYPNSSYTSLSNKQPNQKMGRRPK